jgi:hypothetical protein
MRCRPGVVGRQARTLKFFCLLIEMELDFLSKVVFFAFPPP